MEAIVPIPRDMIKAYLLLEVTHANHQLHLMQWSLALQIVHHDILALQYNHILLKKAQEDLHLADHLIGSVWFIIHRSGIPVASKYAMHKDYTLYGLTINGAWIVVFIWNQSYWLCCDY